MNAVIGVDIGSSGIKAVLYAPETGAVLNHARAPLDARVTKTPQGHFEEDPALIRDATFQLIREITDAAKNAGHHIEAIAFTGQMHGGLIVDEALQPVTSFITWQDKRGDEASLNDRTHVEDLREQYPDDPTGTGIHTGFLLSSLFWMARHGRLPDRGRYVLGIYEWITSVLIGRAVTDVSSASAWAMFDPVSKEWKSDLIRYADIPFEWLPVVAEPGEDIGEIVPRFAAELGLPLETRVHASIGDTQASYLGSGCTRDEVLLNFGTGSQSLWETTIPLATEGTDIRYLNKDTWVVTASTLAGGEAYRILADFYRETVREFAGRDVTPHEIYEAMNRMASTADSSSVVFDPIFAGSKFGGRGDVRASISGLMAMNFTPSNITRALVEGMIEEVARPYFIRKGQRQHDGLVGAGNAMRKNVSLRDAAERRFGLKLRLAEYEEEAAVGAALLAAGAQRIP